jgi:hypothetical protein
MEYWFTKDKTCILHDPVKTIYRKDLGIICTINLRTSQVRIDSIKFKKAEPQDKSLDLKYIGQHYEPEFEWRKPLYLKKDTLANRPCRQFKCEGDADFDRIELEYSLTDLKDKAVAELFSKNITNLYYPQNKREPLLNYIKDHDSMFPLKIIEKVENAIAPYILTEITVEKLETVNNADKIFDIPEKTK